MSCELINQIVIVGGGTAGWITAAKLAKQLNIKQSKSRTITLIESPDIPTVGVGEGTWPTMRKTLLDLGINESEFMSFCQATFKQGTQFVDWKHDKVNGQSSHYYHMFSSIFDPSEFNLAPYWLKDFSNDSIPFAEAVSAQADTCKKGLGPKKITHKQYDGQLSYAYHLDAGRFAEFLTAFATEKLGVRLIKANVSLVNLAENGDIKSVSLDNDTQIDGNLFVDCSGFRSLLLGDALNVDFISIADTLLTDSAIAIQVPYESEDSPIACQTNSTAQEAGWIWDIALFNRRGTGHVFSSEHISSDEAEKVLRDYIRNSGIQASEQLDARHIKMKIGHRRLFWKRNCVAIGLSAAFVEPLEASAIFLIEAAGNMLADMFPSDRVAMDYSAKTFNQSFLYRWEKTIDFIKLHYFLSKRTGRFWQDNRQKETVPERLIERIAHWRRQPVSKYEFDNVFEPFPHESYQYVIYGMGIHEQSRYNLESLSESEQAKARFSQVQKATELINAELPQHRELLEKAYQYGFQTV